MFFGESQNFVLCCLVAFLGWVQAMWPKWHKHYSVVSLWESDTSCLCFCLTCIDMHPAHLGHVRNMKCTIL